MNAKQRRERARVAEAFSTARDVAAVQERTSALELMLRTSEERWEAEKLRAQEFRGALHRAEARVAELERDIDTLRGSVASWRESADAARARVETLELAAVQLRRENAQLKEDDRDASKLRRRLTARGLELDAANETIQRLRRRLHDGEGAEPVAAVPDAVPEASTL